MKIYFDLDKKQLLPAPGDGGILKLVNFIRGDFEPLEAHFFRAGAEVGSVTNIVAVIKQLPGVTAISLADCQTWDESGTTYTGEINLNGDDLNILIGTKLSIGLLFEVTCYQDGHGPITAPAIRCIVTNDLWRGTEGTPYSLPSPDDDWLAHGHAQALSIASKEQAFANLGTPAFDDLAAANTALGIGQIYYDRSLEKQCLTTA